MIKNIIIIIMRGGREGEREKKKRWWWGLWCLWVSNRNLSRNLKRNLNRKLLDISISHVLKNAKIYKRQLGVWGSGEPEGELGPARGEGSGRVTYCLAGHGWLGRTGRAGLADWADWPGFPNVPNSFWIWGPLLCRNWFYRCFQGCLEIAMAFQ